MTSKKEMTNAIIGLLIVVAGLVILGISVGKTVIDRDFYFTHKKEITTEYTKEEIIEAVQNGEMKEFNDFAILFKAYKNLETNEVYYIGNRGFKKDKVYKRL